MLWRLRSRGTVSMTVVNAMRAAGSIEKPNRVHVRLIGNVTANAFQGDPVRNKHCLSRLTNVSPAMMQAGPHPVKATNRGRPVEWRRTAMRRHGTLHGVTDC
jgi:hypothetical protein